MPVGATGHLHPTIRASRPYPERRRSRLMLIVSLSKIATTGSKAHPHCGIDGVNRFLGAGCRHIRDWNFDARVFGKFDFFQWAEDAVFKDRSDGAHGRESSRGTRHTRGESSRSLNRKTHTIFQKKDDPREEKWERGFPKPRCHVSGRCRGRWRDARGLGKPCSHSLSST